MSSDELQIVEEKSLFKLIDQGKTEEALQLIASGKSKPGLENREGETALICACKNFMPEVALALINTGKSKPGHVGRFSTALIWCCMEERRYDSADEYDSEDDDGLYDDDVDNENENIHGGWGNVPDMSEVALALIETGKSRPEYSDFWNMTALMYACNNGVDVETIDSRVPLALIATGKSKPEKYNEEYDSTALWYALRNNRLRNYTSGWSQVVLALIATGKSRPSLEVDGETPLTWACKHNKSDIAIALLETGKSNYEFENEDGETAYDIALENRLKIVAERIEKMRNTFNVSLLSRSTNPIHERVPETVFDTVTGFFGGKKSGKKSRKIQSKTRKSRKTRKST